MFQPSELGIAADPRDLGVRVYGVDFGRSEASPSGAANASAEAEP